MAKKEDVYYALELFHNNRPQKIFDEMNKSEVGLFAVLKCIHESEQELTSADICKSLSFSSARMAVLIKKLEAKGIVTKTNSTQDSRSKILKLSQKGNELAQKLKEHMYNTMDKVVEEFGIDELNDMFKKLSKLREILDENMPTGMEEHND